MCLRWAERPASNSWTYGTRRNVANTSETIAYLLHFSLNLEMYILYNLSYKKTRDLVLFYFSCLAVIHT
jgi:hypothetical protein